MALRYATDVLGPITLVEEHLLDWQRCGLVAETDIPVGV